MKTSTAKYSGLKRIFDMELTISIVLRQDSNTEYEAHISSNVQEGLLTDEYVRSVWIGKNGDIMTDVCDTDEEYEAIVNCFTKYICSIGSLYARQCDVCNKGMNDGYVIDGGQGNICSPKCLYSTYTQEEWACISKGDDEDNYWTEWDGNDDYEYVLFNNQLVSICQPININLK